MSDLTWSPRKLSPDQWARKGILEGNIDRCLVHVKAAEADLLELHRTGLWQADAETFTDYIRKRWPMHDRSLCRLVTKIKVIADLTAPEEDCGEDESPTDESAESETDVYYSEPNTFCAEILARLPPSQRKEAWHIVCSRAAAEEKKPTAKMVEQVICEWEAAEGAAPTTEEIEQSEEELAREEAIARSRQAWKDWHRAMKAARDAYPNFLEDEQREMAEQYCVSLPDRLRRRRGS